MNRIIIFYDADFQKILRYESNEIAVRELARLRVIAARKSNRFSFKLTF